MRERFRAISPRSPQNLAPELSEPLDTLALIWRSQNRAPKTIRTNLEAITWLVLRMKRPPAAWRDLTTNQIREHLAWLAETYSASYASNQYRAIKVTWRYLAQELEIPDPMDGVTGPSVPVELVPLVADFELKRLLATKSTRKWMDDRDRALILLYASSGARLSEIACLKVADLDLPNASAIVTGKAGKQRIVRFSAEAAVSVHRWLRARGYAKLPKTEALWVGRQGAMTPNGVAQMLRRRSRQAGIRVHAHMFRHTFSSDWLEAGGNEGDLMELTGWSTRAMVDRYGAVARQRRALASYDRIRGRG